MNQSAAPPLYGLFRETASRYPDDPAFTFLNAALEARTYTFRELWSAGCQIAERLRILEFGAATPIGILLQSQEEQVLHYLAALAAGLVPAILTPPNRKLRPEIFETTIRTLVASCRFSAIITDMPALQVDATLLQPRTLEVVHRYPGKAEPVGDTAILQFTSGTTGVKRGVRISPAAMRSSLLVYAESLELDRSDRIVSWLPLYHDMGFIACLNMPLASGVHCIMMNPLDWVADPGMFLRAASRYGATLSWNPNFAYAFMADRVGDEQLPGVELSSLRGLINCAEPVTAESQRRFQRRFAPCGLRDDVFRGCYAMAETTFALTDGSSGDATYLDPVGPDAGDLMVKLPQVSVGRPLPGVELAVMNDEGEQMADRTLGELWVRGTFLFSGYFNNPEAISAVMQGEWYKTGDVGYRVGREFFVCSRKKDVLILNGLNVFPQDVEDLVSAIDGVTAGRVAAFSLFSEQFQSEMLVILAESDVQGKDKTDVIVRIRQAILAMLQVANFHVHLVPPLWLIKSSSGKISRQGNKAKWLAESKGPPEKG